MGGLFDDIFDDDDFEIAGEVEEEIELDDEWFGDNKDQQKGASWNTGQKQDLWDANDDDVWTSSDCDDDCDTNCDSCDTGQDDKPDIGPASKPGFDIDDFFS